MKKSQILAALALAFALGVVAPVANAVISADTYAAVTVSDCDLQNAIAQINVYGPYKNFKALFEAQDKWAKSDLKTEGFDDDQIFANTGALVKAIRAFGGSWATFSFAAGTTINQAISAAQSVETVAKYNEWNSLYNAMNATGTDDQALRDGVANVLVNVMKVETYDDIEQYESFTSIKNFVLNTWTKKNNYATYVSLIEAVNDATDYKEIKDALVLALNNVQDWSETANGKTDVENAAEYDETSNYTTVVKLNALASDAKIDGYDEYKTLYNDLKNVKVETGNTYNNETVYNRLETELKAATLAAGGKALGYKSIPAFNGTCGKPNNGSDDNNGGGTNKPGDDNKDPNAPDTGILADGEANASTTVAMVAGIATALTAAGAGVVAYRNARRSTRK